MNDWLKELLTSGLLKYIVRHPDKPRPVYGLKKRGIGYTRKNRVRPKAKRLMAKMSRRKNRKR